MTKWTMRFVVLCGCLLASASLYAHHSLAGVYALGKEAKVTGAFKAFRLVNPHSSLKNRRQGQGWQDSRVGDRRRQRRQHLEARARKNRRRTECPPPRRRNHRHHRSGVGRQESGWTSGSDHLPRRTRSVSGPPMSRGCC